MTLFLMVALVMVNFAANSVLSRAGIDVFGMDALVFSGLRLASGAAMLALLVSLRGQGWPAVTRPRFGAAAYLLIYLIPFSLAYISLPSGIGALILFGVVQVTMFAGSAIAGVRPGAVQWVGMAIAMAGLGWLLWPSGDLRLDLAGVLAMAVAGVGWGLFSLRGRGSSDPLADMAWSFVLVLPVALILMGLGGGWSAWGTVTALVCGAITSGLGYALWYRVLPHIAATTGAVAQLSVPIIALVAGALTLGEALTVEVALAAAVVLGGIGVTVLGRKT